MGFDELDRKIQSVPCPDCGHQEGKGGGFTGMAVLRLLTGLMLLGVGVLKLSLGGAGAAGGILVLGGAGIVLVQLLRSTDGDGDPTGLEFVREDGSKTEGRSTSLRAARARRRARATD